MIMAALDISKAVSLAQRNFPYKAGAFYGAADGLSLGIGIIYQGVRFPLFDDGPRLFDTVEGLAYVLTHECDVDPSNDRHFNKDVLICPIILFGDFAEEFSTCFNEGALFGILPDIAADRIYRVFYFPPSFVDVLDRGGLIFLNQICSTHVDEFSDGRAQPVCALSDYAQNILDKKLQNHLLRPKVEMLPRLQ